MGANSGILTALRWACGTANIIGLRDLFYEYICKRLQ